MGFVPEDSSGQLTTIDLARRFARYKYLGTEGLKDLLFDFRKKENVVPDSVCVNDENSKSFGQAASQRTFSGSDPAGNADYGSTS